MPDAPELEDILALPGNALALSRAPNHLILTRLSPAAAIERLRERDEESRGVFADIELLQRVDERFSSDWFRALFQSRGTTIHDLPTDMSPEQTATRALALISSLMGEE